MKQVRKSFEALGDYVMLIAKVLWLSIQRPPSLRLVRNQMYEVGVLSLPVVAFTGFSTGMVLAAQAFFQLADKGLASATGWSAAGNSHGEERPPDPMLPRASSQAAHRGKSGKAR